MLTEILASVDPLSFGRGERLRDYMATFCRCMGMHNSWELEIAAMLSAIGNVTVPPKVLEKIRLKLELVGAERDVFLRVPEIGANLLANIPRLESVASIVLYQSKNFDGSGDDVVGQAIPLGARILRVLADLCQLELEGNAKGRALEKMQRQAGRYDPQVLVNAFASFDVDLPSVLSVKIISRAVSLKDLLVGNVLTANVETTDGVLIVCAGTKVSQMALEKLRNFQQVQGIREPLQIQTQELKS
jgi:response regulator RpfG family c-di-GMP phosphodiesterase